MRVTALGALNQSYALGPITNFIALCQNETNPLVYEIVYHNNQSYALGPILISLPSAKMRQIPWFMK